MIEVWRVSRAHIHSLWMLALNWLTRERSLNTSHQYCAGTFWSPQALGAKWPHSTLRVLEGPPAPSSAYIGKHGVHIIYVYNPPIFSLAIWKIGFINLSLNRKESCKKNSYLYPISKNCNDNLNIPTREIGIAYKYKTPSFKDGFIQLTAHGY